MPEKEFDYEGDHLDKYDNDDDGLKSSQFDFVPRGYNKRGKNSDNEKPSLKLRACLSCRLVMTEGQFYENGCGNCAFLQMDGDRRRTLDCTSTNFSGLIAIMDPQKSWAAHYNNLSDMIPGCYAISVTGVLPESIKDEIE